MLKILVGTALVSNRQITTEIFTIEQEAWPVGPAFSHV